MKRYRKKERVYQESEQRLELEREWNDEVMYRVMIGLSAAAVLAAVVLFLLPDLRAYVQDRPCILRQMTGLYCPGCGGTRAVLFLLHGQEFLLQPGSQLCDPICLCLYDLPYPETRDQRQNPGIPLPQRVLLSGSGAFCRQLGLEELYASDPASDADPLAINNKRNQRDPRRIG